jgi:hypothetical protein
MKAIKNFNWYLLLVVFILSSMIVYAVPALAVVWTGTLTVVNNTTSNYTYPQIQSTFNNTQIINDGYSQADQLDVLIQSTNGSNLAMMPTDLYTWFTMPFVDANSYTSFLWTSDNPAKTSHQILVGNGGQIDTLDHADLEMGGNFTLIVDGYFLTSAGSDKNILVKLNGGGYAFKFYNPSASNITVSLDNGAAEVSAAVASGEYEITVIADGTNLELYVDSVLQDTVALGGASVPDVADNLTWIQNNVMPYVNLIKLLTR